MTTLGLPGDYMDQPFGIISIVVIMGVYYLGRLIYEWVTEDPSSSRRKRSDQHPK